MASNVSYNVNATRASLQSWLTVINSDFKACPANCTSAQTSLFRMRNPPPWLFVEVNESCVPLPFFSQQLTFQTSSNASVVYRLVGIIYLGGGHFASKLFDMDGSIWNYDGQNADGFATYGGTLINQSPLSFTQLNDKSLMCFHNCALVIAMRMIHVRSVHNDETAIMVEHHSLASRFKTELEAENSVLQSTRTARLDLAFHDNFGIMMDDDDVATVRVVGFVGRSKDMGPLANQWKATGEFSVSNIAKLRFNFPVVPPHHSLDRSLLDMHLQVSCALGDIVTRATKRLECQYPQGLSKVISWKTVDGYTLGTNNIFDDTEPLKTNIDFSTAKYKSGGLSELRAGPVEEKDLTLDVNGVPLYTLLDWPALRARTERMGLGRSLVKAENFNITNSEGARFPSIRLPDVAKNGVPFVANVHICSFYNDKDKRATLALRLESLALCEVPTYVAQKSDTPTLPPTAHVSFQTLVDNAKKRKAAENLNPGSSKRTGTGSHSNVLPSPTNTSPPLTAMSSPGFSGAGSETPLPRFMHSPGSQTPATQHSSEMKEGNEMDL